MNTIFKNPLLLHLDDFRFVEGKVKNYNFWVDKTSFQRIKLMSTQGVSENEIEKKKAVDWSENHF